MGIRIDTYGAIRRMSKIKFQDGSKALWQSKCLSSIQFLILEK